MAGGFGLYAEAVYLFRSNRQAGIKTLEKYTKVKEQDILEDAYSQFRDYLESIPYVSRNGLERILAEVAEKDASANAANP